MFRRTREVSVRTRSVRRLTWTIDGEHKDAAQSVLRIGTNIMNTDQERVQHAPTYELLFRDTEFPLS